MADIDDLPRLSVRDLGNLDRVRSVLSETEAVHLVTDDGGSIGVLMGATVFRLVTSFVAIARQPDLYNQTFGAEPARYADARPLTEARREYQHILNE